MIEQFLCLATAIFFEARNQDFDGMVAVGEVILTRVESEMYPDDFCSVINQPRQFSFTHDGMSDNPEDYDSHFDSLAWDLSQEAAVAVLNGPTDFANGATHFHADYVTPYWSESFELVGQIGDHIFYIEIR